MFVINIIIIFTTKFTQRQNKQVTINKYSLFYSIFFDGYWPSMLARACVAGLKASAGGPIHS